MPTDLPAPRVLDESRLTPLQRITIDNMERSSRECVPVTVIQYARAENLLHRREEYRRAGASPAVTVTSLLAHALVSTLACHPDINATVSDGVKTRYRDVGLGLAVATPNGDLMVATVHQAQELDVHQLAERLDLLANAARNGRLGLADVRGATFTLSSIGMVMPGGVGTAVIPHGQAGVLVVGGVEKRPVIEEAQVGVGSVFPLSLTYDHRIANGVALWTFFRDLVHAIESTPPAKAE